MKARLPKKEMPANRTIGRGCDDGSRQLLQHETFYHLLCTAYTTTYPRNPPLHKQSPHPLAHLEYSQELELKNSAFQRFWKTINLPSKPTSFIASAIPRHYRTTSKRRVVIHNNKPCLHFAGRLPYSEKEFSYHNNAGTQNRFGPRRTYTPDNALQSSLDYTCENGVMTSVLEPFEHTTIFTCIAETMRQQKMRSVSRNLSYIIIRGSYEEFVVIFNVHAIDADTVRALKRLSEELQKLVVAVRASFIFYDPSRSPYYFESAPAAGHFKTKNLYGPDFFLIHVSKLTFRVPFTSFSQVNLSIVPFVCRTMQEMVANSGGDRLLDLFCGYGLFSTYLASSYRNIVGIDADAGSIEAARRNCRDNNPGKRIAFKQAMITKNHLANLLPKVDLHLTEDCILDPPRSGIDESTMAAIACRRPRAVLHLFCSVDEIATSLAHWHRFGYKPVRVVPFDMFAGTPNCEVLVHLEKE
ncbi:MAG: methyltransferase domain-containing protein [Chitinivibrionales bacterium]|nr:methyltransferase domain-containing protein [Chitinivibrionales bacterium]